MDRVCAKVSLDSVKMTPNLEDYSLELEYNVNAPECMLDGSLMVEAQISFKDRLISRTYTAMTAGHMAARFDLDVKKADCLEWTVQTWSPEEPNLYDIEFRLVNGGEVLDQVGSYFAMREIRIDGPNILLNGRPLYQRLILDQGYWGPSHLTPPSEEALIEDIDKIHALGYNGLRKHQKTEDERFLYWCDVKGMLVWSEVPLPISSLTTRWRSLPESGWKSYARTTIIPVSSPGRPSMSPGVSIRWRQSGQSSISPRPSTILPRVLTGIVR